MNIDKLAKVLEKMYVEAPDRDQVAMIHLFGICYADELKSSRLNKKEIVRLANIHEAYVTEINKGVRLAQYVRVDDSLLNRIKRIEQEVL